MGAPHPTGCAQLGACFRIGLNAAPSPMGLRLSTELPLPRSHPRNKRACRGPPLAQFGLTLAQFVLARHRFLPSSIGSMAPMGWGSLSPAWEQFWECCGQAELCQQGSRERGPHPQPRQDPSPEQSPFALPKLPFPRAVGRSSATLLRLFWGSHAGIGAGTISCCPALGANIGADAQPGRRWWCRGRCPQDPTAGSPGDFTETLLGIFQALPPAIQSKSLKDFFFLIQVKPKQSHVPAKIATHSLNFSTVSKQN